jgi:hypothetical protein
VSGVPGVSSIVTGDGTSDITGCDYQWKDVGFFPVS